MSSSVHDGDGSSNRPDGRVDAGSVASGGDLARPAGDQLVGEDLAARRSPVAGDAVARHRRQFRITATRPAAATGSVGKVNVAVNAPLAPAGLSFDGPVP